MNAAHSVVALVGGLNMLTCNGNLCVQGASLNPGFAFLFFVVFFLFKLSDLHMCIRIHNLLRTTSYG